MTDAPAPGAHDLAGRSSSAGETPAPLAPGAVGRPPTPGPDRSAAGRAPGGPTLFDTLRALMEGYDPPDFTPLAYRPAWHADAACREHPELRWLTEKPSPATAARLTAVCDRCLVRRECFDFALEHHPVQGVWGGSTEADRRRLAGPTHGGVAERRDLVESLYRQGEDAPSIADRLGVPVKTVRNDLAHLAAKVRPDGHGEAAS